jgi:hypothetical protein
MSHDGNQDKNRNKFPPWPPFKGSRNEEEDLMAIVNSSWTLPPSISFIIFSLIEMTLNYNN